MTVLSRTARLAIAAETQAARYAAPVFTVTYSKPPVYRQVIAPLEDTHLRGSDSELQDLEQGWWYTQWEIPSDGYPDLIGWWLRAIIGPDTCTPGVVTTLTAPVSAGAASLTTAARPPAGSCVMIGAGETLEYARLGTPTGTGPYACPLTTGLLYAHAAGEAVQSQATHSFGQEFAAGFRTQSLTISDGTGPLGFPGCAMTGLTLTILPGGYVTMRALLSGYPAQSVSDFTYDATPAQPIAGWEWQILQGATGAMVTWHNGTASPTARPLALPDETFSTSAQQASTRGQKMVLKLTRKTDVIPAIAGSQGPAVIAPGGALRVNGSYTAIYEDQSDMASYLESLLLPVTHALIQPDLQGGCSLTLELPKSGTYAGEADASGDYLAARYELSAIASPVAGPCVTATLANYVQSAY